MATHPSIEQALRDILARTLSLGQRAQTLERHSRLLGSVPELDSMGVAAVLAALEEAFGLRVADDEIDAATFETLGSLADYVRGKL